MSNLLSLLIPLLVVVSVCLIGWTTLQITSRVQGRGREYMDPLSPKLKLIWPAVQFVTFYTGRFVSVEYLESTRKQLQRSGLYFVMSPEEFFSLKIVVALLVGLATAVGLSTAKMEVFPLVLFGVLIGFMMPTMSMTEQRKKREKEIVRLLPTYLDFMTMAVEAGLSLTGAIAQAINNGPPGLLKLELEKVMRDVKAGAGRVEALIAMSERLEIKEVSTLVNSLAQAERTGGSVGETLRRQADQRRVERFQRAEKLAMEAPVKLVFPLVAFIFPCTFIVLGFPLVMKFLHEM